MGDLKGIFQVKSSPYINNRQPYGSLSRNVLWKPAEGRTSSVGNYKLDLNLTFDCVGGLASDPVSLRRARGRTLWLSFSQPRAASSHSHRLHTQACTERTPSLENSVPFRPFSDHPTRPCSVGCKTATVRSTVWHSDAENQPYRLKKKIFVQSYLVLIATCTRTWS